MECETNDCRKEKRGCKGCFYSDEEENKCEYCTTRTSKIEICGKYFDLQKTAGYTRPHISYSSWIMKNKNDKNAGIMFANHGGEAVYFDINYCPMCGRKLV